MNQPSPQSPADFVEADEPTVEAPTLLASGLPLLGHKEEACPPRDSQEKDSLDFAADLFGEGTEIDGIEAWQQEASFRPGGLFQGFSPWDGSWGGVGLPSMGLHGVGMPDMPGMPGMPNMPNIPNMPNMPNMPDMPNMPGFGQGYYYDTQPGTAPWSGSGAKYGGDTEKQASFWPGEDVMPSHAGNYFASKNNYLNYSMLRMRNMWIYVGLFVILMLVLIPVWNTFVLLEDPSYIYFAGKVVPRGFISMCVSIPILYVCAVSLLFKRGDPKVLTEQSMLYMGIVFLSALGAGFMILSLPLAWSSNNAYTELFGNCETGWKTRDLFGADRALQTLRTQPTCAAKFSVELCDGYAATPFTEVLKAMETSYRCSGFCYGPSSPQAFPPQAPSFIQVRQSQQHRFSPRPIGVLAPLKPTRMELPARPAIAVPEETVNLEAVKTEQPEEVVATQSPEPAAAPEPVPVPEQPTASETDSTEPTPLSDFNVAMAQGPAKTQVERPQPAPPTLFSQENYKASCDGMSARTMKLAVGDIATQTFIEGVVLVAVSLFAGLLHLLGSCTQKHKEEPPLRYGYHD